MRKAPPKASHHVTASRGGVRQVLRVFVAVPPEPRTCRRPRRKWYPWSVGRYAVDLKHFNEIVCTNPAKPGILRIQVDKRKDRTDADRRSSRLSVIFSCARSGG